MINKFKQTEIGEIPEDWQYDKLENLTMFIRDGTHTPPKRVEEGVPLLSARNVLSGELQRFEDDTYITEEDYRKIHSKYEIQNDDVLLTIVGSIGNSLVVNTNYKFTLQRSVAIIRPNNNKITSKFLSYVFQSTQLQQQLKNNTKTTNQSGIYLKELNNLLIPIASIFEQQKISYVLSAIDGAIQNSTEIIQKMQLLKDELMHQLLTSGINHTRFMQSEIGVIPQDWEIARIKDLVIDVKSGFASGKRDEKGIIQLRMNNLSTDGKIVLDQTLKVPTPNNVEDYLLKPDDVLFNNTNSVELVGKSAVFNGELENVTYSNHITRIRVNKNKITPDWLLYNLIRKWVLGYFRSVCVRHVGQAGVRNSDLFSMIIPMPPLTEQQKIIEILSTINSDLTKEIDRNDQLNSLKRGLLADLLTGKKRLN